MLKNKKIIIVAVIVAIIAIAFFATGPARDRKREMNDIENELAAYRSGESNSLIILCDRWMTDTRFQEFITDKVQEMFDNKEYKLLRDFLHVLYNKREPTYDFLKDAVTNCFNGISDIDVALDAYDQLKYDKDIDYDLLGDYTEGIALSAKTGILGDYINKNGINSITMRRRGGYYADKENEHTSSRVGLSNSPLYDAYTAEYFGDFCYKEKSGVKLNSFYEETSYSEKHYFFRDEGIPFSPYDGECIWSGSYLFLLDDNKNLIDLTQVKEKSDEESSFENASLDYTEPDNVVKSFEIGDAKISLNHDWYYELNDKSCTIYPYKEKPEKIYDEFYISYMSKSVDERASSQDVKKGFESIAKSICETGYPKADILVKEHVYKDRLPAYHFTVNDKKVKYTVDAYLIMPNDTDVMILYNVHTGSSKEDFSEEFLNLIRSIDTR